MEDLPVYVNTKSDPEGVVLPFIQPRSIEGAWPKPRPFEENKDKTAQPLRTIFIVTLCVLVDHDHLR